MRSDNSASIRDQPLVTIGVASFNNSKYILETLDSILNQTYRNFELIIVDDCSTDNSLSIIEEWVNKYKDQIRICLIKKNINEGITKVCSIILNNSQGKYLTTFSSDDIMLPNKICDLISYLENANQDIAGVFAIAESINSNGESLDQIFPGVEIKDGTKDTLFEQMAENMVIHTLTTLIRVDCIKEVGGFNEKYWYEDHDLFLRLLTKYRLVFLPIHVVKYRTHDNQTKKKFSTKVNTDKVRLLFDHYHKIGKYKIAFQNGIRRPLRHLAIHGGDVKIKIVLLYLKYFTEFRDLRGIYWLMVYIFKPKNSIIKLYLLLFILKF